MSRVEVIRGSLHAAHLSANDDLTAVGLWLQQDGIHVDGWLDPSCHRLRELRPADFAPAATYGGIVGPVLSLKRSHPYALPGEHAAQARYPGPLANRSTDALAPQHRRHR